MKLGKNQLMIFILLGLSTTTYYYVNKLINTSQGTFSDGILVGFLLCLTFIFCLAIMFLWIRMIYLNYKQGKEDVKTTFNKHK